MDATGFLKIETPTVTEPWRKVLLDAADYIDAHGWCQNSMGDPGGPRCALGAVLFVDNGDGAHAYDRLTKWIGGPGIVVPDWNDTPGRTAAEVCAALRSCAVQP